MYNMSSVYCFIISQLFIKGEEKGYFKFGGSTTILFLEKDTVKIDSDILEQSKIGFECKVNCGEQIGLKV